MFENSYDVLKINHFKIKHVFHVLAMHHETLMEYKDITFY